MTQIIHRTKIVSSCWASVPSFVSLLWYMLIGKMKQKSGSFRGVRRLNTDAITYFKTMADQTGLPYQNLINLYLTECAHSGKRLALKWAS